jgi:hypothetical protein
MIKRMTKATSLLVAAAAIVSIVPATGANAADYKKVSAEEGTIYSAEAYKDGKFFIDGNVKDGDTEAAYFLNNGQYSELDNVDTGSDVQLYGDKYVDVDGGNYYVDLESGNVTDEDLSANNADDAASALRKAIKGKADDRYTDDAVLKTNLTELPGAKFSKTWYATTYTGDATYNVYTDVNGNYIDADYNVGKIKVTTTTGSATLTNTKDSDNGVKAAVSDTAVIGQDANYIYRTATITVTSTGAAITKINNKAVTQGQTVTFSAIQKISKAQASDDIDGAKYAKTVATYQIADKDGVAATLLADSSKTIADGKVIAYTNADGKVDVQTIALKSDAGFNYTDITDVDAEDATALDVDADGNIWRLDAGYVYKFDNDENWTKVYKVDGAMDKLSVYDQDNLVVWNETDEVYSIVGSKDATETPVETPTETPVVNKGWVNTNAGWTFYNASGSQVKGQWVNDGGVWYYIKADGVMATGWVKDGANWYYLQSSGAMKTGWVNDNGTWYYLQSSGAMKTGWLNDNGTWYYLNASGAMLANTTVDGYKLNASGAWVK